MLLKLLAVGTKLPQWIQQGYREYAQRMPRECRLELFEIALGARSTTAEKARADECERMLRAIRREDYVIALDVTGKQFDTPKLAQLLQEWMFGGHDVAFCIGGPPSITINRKRNPCSNKAPFGHPMKPGAFCCG